MATRSMPADEAKLALGPAPAASPAFAAVASSSSSSVSTVTSHTGPTSSRPAQTLCPGHSRPIFDICFSPFTAHGLLLASAGADATPMLREGLTGDWIGSFHGHGGAVTATRFSRWGVHVATASADLTARVWDVAMGTELLSIPHVHGVRGCAFTNDSYSLVTVAGAGGLRVTSLAAAATAAASSTSAAAARPPKGATPPAGSDAAAPAMVATTADPNVVATAAPVEGAAGVVTFWDLRTMKPVRNITLTPASKGPSTVAGEVVSLLAAAGTAAGVSTAATAAGAGTGAITATCAEGNSAVYTEAPASSGPLPLYIPTSASASVSASTSTGASARARESAVPSGPFSLRIPLPRSAAAPGAVTSGRVELSTGKVVLAAGTAVIGTTLQHAHAHNEATTTAAAAGATAGCGNGDDGCVLWVKKSHNGRVRCVDIAPAAPAGYSSHGAGASASAGAATGAGGVVASAGEDGQVILWGWEEVRAAAAAAVAAAAAAAPPLVVL